MTGRALSERFDRRVTEVARARRVVRAALHAWHLEAEAPALELVVSELVSNALLHGGGTITVRMWAEADRLGLEVTDEGRQPRGTPAVRAQADGTGGWGLRLVEDLSDCWGVHVEERGTRVWMTRSSTGGAAAPADRRPDHAGDAAGLAPHGPAGPRRHHR